MSKRATEKWNEAAMLCKHCQYLSFLSWVRYCVLTLPLGANELNQIEQYQQPICGYIATELLVH